MIKRFLFKKLVRDNSLVFFQREKIKTHYEILETPDCIQALKEKLTEEADEVLQATDMSNLIEELGDLQEVIAALMEKCHISQAEIETARDKKKLEWGGFSEGIYLQHIDMRSDSVWVNHFLRQPHKYPVEILEESN